MPEQVSHWMFPIPFMVSAWRHLTPATCVPDPCLAMAMPWQSPFAVLGPSADPWMSGALSPSIRYHCLESCNTSDLCTGSRFGSEIIHTEVQVTSVSVCRPMGSAGALSGSIRSHCIESSHTSDLCTRCIFGGDILHTEAPCQLCVHLPAHLCQGLFLVPLIVIA